MPPNLPRLSRMSSSIIYSHDGENNKVYLEMYKDSIWDRQADIQTHRLSDRQSECLAHIIHCTVYMHARRWVVKPRHRWNNHTQCDINGHFSGKTTLSQLPQFSFSMYSISTSSILFSSDWFSSGQTVHPHSMPPNLPRLTPMSSSIVRNFTAD